MLVYQYIALFANFVMIFIEKELKVLNIDLVKVLVTLEELGAVKKYDTTLYDVYFDTVYDEYGSQNKNVRIRYTSGGDVLTFKHRIPCKKYKSAYEDEYTIDGKDAHMALVDEGCVPKRAKYKRRISYHLDALTIDIDLYPGIPPLLEIEAATVQEIYAGIKLLGLQEKNTATCGARGLFRRYDRIVERFYTLD